MVSKELFKNLMKAIRETSEQDGDLEVAHILADKLMMETLEGLGYAEGVKFFKEMHKWYA